MEHIENLVFDYNYQLKNVMDWDGWYDMKIPVKQIEKHQKLEFQIITTILNYCIEKEHLEKPSNIIVNNIYDKYFKYSEIINWDDMKNYIIFLTHKH
jgi:hypothetical protein